MIFSGQFSRKTFIDTIHIIIFRSTKQNEKLQKVNGLYPKQHRLNIITTLLIQTLKHNNLYYTISANSEITYNDTTIQFQIYVLKYFIERYDDFTH